jgi:hypothetical protein
VAWTVNSSGLSLNIPAFLTTQSVQTQASGNIPRSGFTTTATAGTAVVGTHDTDGLKLGVPAYLTTAQPTGAYLTTARASNDAVGLNTAQTNVTWTVNSSGLSINAGGYAGTGFTSTSTAGSDIKATHNTAGLSMAVPAFLTTSAAQTNQTLGLYGLGNTTQNSSTTLDARTVSLNGLGAMTVGYSNGSVQLSAPATSSLVGTSGISVSTNGSTISVMETPWSGYIVPQDGITIAGSAQANSSVSIFPIYIPRALAFSHVKFLASYSYASAGNTSSASQAYSASLVLYTRNSDTLNSVWSGKQQSNSFYQSNSTTALAGVRGINMTGVATTLPPDQYWAALHVSTTNSGAGGATTALGASVSLVVAVAQATAAMQADNWNGGATNQSRALFVGQGLFATGATMATIGFTNAAFSQTGNSATLAEVVLNFQNWTLF